MELVFATNNQHKLKEVRKIILPSIRLKSLEDIDCTDDLPETGSTIRSNAYQKARYVHDKFGVDCFADDTGLEVAALDRRPGVHSARYAGERANASDNIEKLLTELKNVTDRRAAFRTVIALLIGEKEYFFEGYLEGTITDSPSGSSGFGYDPVFRPTGSDRTFAEMNEDEKNAISHRAIAIRELMTFLNTKFIVEN